MIQVSQVNPNPGDWPSTKVLRRLHKRRKKSNHLRNRESNICCLYQSGSPHPALPRFFRFQCSLLSVAELVGNSMSILSSVLGKSVAKMFFYFIYSFSIIRSLFLKEIEVLAQAANAGRPLQQALEKHSKLDFLCFSAFYSCCMVWETIAKPFRYRVLRGTTRSCFDCLALCQFVWRTDNG